MMKKLFLSFFVLPAIAFSQGPSLKSAVEALQKDPVMKHAAWSVCVQSAKKDSTLFEYNSQQSLIPASTLKTLVTGAALSTLGADFRFETKIQYDGSYDSINGLIKGNLYILGGGDPSLESHYFRNKKDTLSTVEAWADILKKKGIKKIEGAVIADAGIFEDNMTPPQWIWADMGNYFGAGASGLSYHDNKYSAYYNSGAAGTTAKLVSVKPQIPGMVLQTSVSALGTDDNAFIYGSQYSFYRNASGTIPPNKTNYEVEGSIPDPPLFCAQSFQKALDQAGIKVTEQAGTVRELREKNEYASATRRTVHTHYSPTLDKIVYWTNMKSLNLYAEHLLKFLAYRKGGFGTTTHGTEVVTAFWKSKGVDVSGLFMNDGSGLSRSNVITTRTQCQMLRAMSKEKTYNSFYNSLPVAGRSGSLGGLCEGTCAEGNLRAKSGYITRARGYSGYVKTKSGELVCFSVLANNYNCTPTEMKKRLEKLLVAIAEL
jgi:D-alanyl-D-alanine carboxypeptidase/D-alanyl-D-alanine-endopeptidase (penicillin-binding protein 4)